MGCFCLFWTENCLLCLFILKLSSAYTDNYSLQSNRLENTPYSNNKMSPFFIYYDILFIY